MIHNRALRESQNLEPDVRVANVAIHMNMVEDAKRMFEKGKHFDRLNTLHQVGKESFSVQELFPHQSELVSQMSAPFCVSRPVVCGTEH